MSETYEQFMCAEGQGQTKQKFYILSTHCTAMQNGQALEHVRKDACLLNPNQIPELIMDGEVTSPYAMWLLQNMRNTVKMFYWNHIYDHRVNIQRVPVLRLHSTQIQPVPLKNMMIRFGLTHRKNGHQNCSGHCPCLQQSVAYTHLQ
jgi:hypothetical protein